MFWPPRLVRLPPTKAICAVPHQWPSSPTASTRRIRASDRRLRHRKPSSAVASARRGGQAARRLRRTARDAAGRGSAAAAETRPTSRSKTSRASDSSGSCVLPARKTMSSSAMPASCASRCVFGMLRSVRAPSNLIEPVICTAARPSAERDETARHIPRSARRSGRSCPARAAASQRDPPVAAKALFAEPAVDDRDLRAVLAWPRRPGSATAPARPAPAASGRMRRIARRTAQVKSSGQ